MRTFKFHQGDVQGTSIKKIPDGAKKVENTPIAYGEISGHVHILTGEVEMYEDTNFRYANVKGKKGARLQHVAEVLINPKNMVSTEELQIADHKPILLPPGFYKFGIQKKYNPFSKVFEKVVD
jgi:hypothetical protein